MCKFLFQYTASNGKIFFEIIENPYCSDAVCFYEEKYPARIGKYRVYELLEIRG